MSLHLSLPSLWLDSASAFVMSYYASHWTALSILCLAATIHFTLHNKRRSLPIFNPPKLWQPTIFKKIEFIKNGPEILRQSEKLYGNTAYRLIAHIGETIMLPVSFADIIRNESRLSTGPVFQKVGTRPHEDSSRVYRHV